ncbi:hypothetical protein IC757_06690 [Wenzhouxiangella sp. AB-CW3]|uniref:hypothetical protein n=1 Tax=Wenzhouxiangella sp. AB-CW3 TaxID=2771012 RepID=UPI00168A48E4|nr:hypothetical protein [Wenzhouxiangella sp. AB-CW3]QOC23807.1 hypothetical protein IC757_06690 [Wenzhouxiangella sp. AB-CW3]
MKNVTITLDPETARWARMEAARRNTSVSRLVGEMLREHREREQAIKNAADRFFGRTPVKMRKTDEPYPTRENLYDRDILR